MNTPNPFFNGATTVSFLKKNASPDALTLRKVIPYFHNRKNLPANHSCLMHPHEKDKTFFLQEELKGLHSYIMAKNLRIKNLSEVDWDLGVGS